MQHHMYRSPPATVYTQVLLLAHLVELSCLHLTRDAPGDGHTQLSQHVKLPRIVGLHDSQAVAVSCVSTTWAANHSYWSAATVH